jgi:hypothetical protein
MAERGQATERRRSLERLAPREIHAGAEGDQDMTHPTREGAIAMWKAAVRR